MLLQPGEPYRVSKITAFPKTQRKILGLPPCNGINGTCPSTIQIGRDLN